MRSYYNLSLCPGATNVCAIAGKFTNRSGSDEIIIGQGEVLSLLSPDGYGEMDDLSSISLATTIRSMAHHRSPQGHFILVGLNIGGFLSVQITTGGSLEIKNRVHFDNPVQFLAADRQGRAILAVLRNQNKFYIALNVVGPPARIEIPDSNTITYAVVALNDEKNICFAAIEDDIPDDGQMHIAYYEAKPEGIVRSKVSVDGEANLLLAAPGGENGPGGILVFTKHMVIYKKGDSPDVSTPHVPEERGALIVSATTCHRHPQHGLFCVFQTEFGDIFMVSLHLGDFGVEGLSIEPFNTIPVSNTMCLLGSGILFTASKTGSHALYQLSDKTLFRTDENERILEMKVMKLTEEKTDLILNLCSRGVLDCSLRKLQPGLKIEKIAETTLRARPNALWRVKKNVHERSTETIVVSFANETQFMDMSLNQNETRVILKDLEFDVKKPSLAVSILGNGSMLHVHRRGIIHVTTDRQRTDIRKMEGEIVKIAHNKFQVVIALRGGKLIYYTVSTNQGYDALKVGGRCRMSSEVSCLCILQVPEGKNRSFCLAVGLADRRIVILALDPRDPTDQVFEVLSILTMLSTPKSLLFHPPQEGNKPPYHFLIAGLENGFLNTMVMVSSGRLWVLSSRYLGSRTPELFSAIIRDQQVIICLSDRSWIGFMHGQRFLLTPLSCEALDSVASICCHRRKGIVAVTGDRLKLLTIEDLYNNFSEKDICPDYSPEIFMLHPEQELIVVISNEQGELPEEDKDGDEEGGWVSRIMILDPRSGKTLSRLELRENETVHNACTVNFDNNWKHKTLLAVSIGITEPPAGLIRIYRISGGGRSLAVLQNTRVRQFPGVLSQFKGALLAAIGPVLRMYDLVEDKLHMRCETRIFPDTCIIGSMNVVDDRIYVRDNTEAIHCFTYRTSENQLHGFKYSNVPSSISAFLHIESSAMAWADKFENVVFVEILAEFPRSSKTGGAKSYVPVEEVEEMRFQVGDVVTCLQNASLVPGGEECIIYGTDRGNLGALLPLNMEDVKLLSGLEKQMWRECPPLCTRIPRNNDYPCNWVIDGDICERFQILDSGSQRSIADKLGTTAIEILRKLGATRNKII